MTGPRLQQRLEELSLVAEVASAMLSPLDLQPVLDIAVEKVSTLLGARFGSILTLSADKQFLDFAALYNLTSEYVSEVRRKEPVRADRSTAAGRALLTRRPYAIEDVDTDPIFTPYRELAAREGYRSIICVPLEVGEGAIGTLNLYFAAPRHFSASEIRLLGVVSQQVCLAIERAHLYEQLKHQHELAQAASERKSEFLTAMNHELRVPMTAILGFADLLLKQVSGPLNSKQQRQLRLISSSAQHLMLLINDALDLAKIEAGRMEWRPEPVDAGGLVAEVLTMMEPVAEAKGLWIEWREPPDPVMLRCDRQKGKQILVNLVSNAIKFTSRGGVQIDASRDAGIGRINVSDTGSGLREEEIPMLFEQFRRLRTISGDSTPGSGLGLSISRKLARLMGGDIEVQSRFGQGSTFTLRLESIDGGLSQTA